MKLTTDETGKTTCELSTQDRKALAAAKTIVEQWEYHHRHDPRDNGPTLADRIGSLLSGPNLEPESVPEDE